MLELLHAFNYSSFVLILLLYKPLEFKYFPMQISYVLDFFFILYTIFSFISDFFLLFSFFFKEMFFFEDAGLGSELRRFS